MPDIMSRHSKNGYTFYYHTSTFVKHKITAHSEREEMRNTNTPEAVDQYSMNLSSSSYADGFWVWENRKGTSSEKICINMKEIA